MKHIILILAFVASAYADNVSVPTIPFTFSPGQTIFSSQINSNFSTLITGLGNIGTANIIASGVGTTQLANTSVTSGKLDTAVAASLNQTGFIQDYVGTTAPTGWVLASGKTIGDASSGGTERANADTLNLFTLLYTSMADAQAPVSGGRGASAAADYGAHKTITVPDLRGRVVAGVDNMGGSTASRLTNAESGITGTTNGLAGGSQSTTLTIAQLAAHTHAHTGTHQHAVSGSFSAAFGAGGGTAFTTGGSVNASAVSPGPTDSTGSGATHLNTQPTMVLYKIIKL